MKDEVAAPTYAGYRFPAAIIGHAVWLYFRFALSYRDVEELLAERGVILTDETVRQWCRTLGQHYAHARRRRPRTGDTWPLAAVFIAGNGVQHDLWRAVDRAGNGRAILVPTRHDKRAAVQFLRTPLPGLADGIVR